MNQIDVSVCGPAIFGSDIELFQKSMGIKLPLDYAEFLLKYNGGRIHPNSVYIDTSDTLDDDWVDIDVIYPLIAGKPDVISRVNLKQAIERQISYGPSEGLIPEGSIPIGSIMSKDDLLLFVDGNKHHGEVWVKLWHMCDDNSFSCPWSYCYKVASNFSEFLDHLTNDPD